jgi:hypothetical protein
MFKIKLTIFLLSVLTLILVGCGEQNISTQIAIDNSTNTTTTSVIRPLYKESIPPPPIINEAKSIIIALNYLPLDIISQGNISNYYHWNIGKNGSWLIQLNDVILTKDQLLQTGWNEGDFNDTGTKYKGVIINVDAVNGDVISKNAIPEKSVNIGEFPLPGIISENSSIIIAGRYGPIDESIKARIFTISSNQTWIIYYLLDITKEKLGWNRDVNTYLDNLDSGESYFEIAIQINADTGALIQRAAFAYPATTTAGLSSH